jgi:hypothetical protein
MPNRWTYECIKQQKVCNLILTEGSTEITKRSGKSRGTSQVHNEKVGLIICSPATVLLGKGKGKPSLYRRRKAPRTRRMRRLGFSESLHIKVARLSSRCTGRLYHQGNPWYSYLLQTDLGKRPLAKPRSRYVVKMDADIREARCENGEAWRDLFGILLKNRLC